MQRRSGGEQGGKAHCRPLASTSLSFFFSPQSTPAGKTSKAIRFDATSMVQNITRASRHRLLSKTPHGIHRLTCAWADMRGVRGRRCGERKTERRVWCILFFSFGLFIVACLGFLCYCVIYCRSYIHACFVHEVSLTPLQSVCIPVATLSKKRILLCSITNRSSTPPPPRAILSPLQTVEALVLPLGNHRIKNNVRRRGVFGTMLGSLAHSLTRYTTPGIPLSRVACV